MKNRGELVLDALRSMRAVYGGPNTDSWHRMLTITGDKNSPDKPARAIGIAGLLGKFDSKQGRCPLIYELVIYKGFVIYRSLGGFEGVKKMAHRKGFC